MFKNLLQSFYSFKSLFKKNVFLLHLFDHFKLASIKEKNGKLWSQNSEKMTLFDKF